MYNTNIKIFARQACTIRRYSFIKTDGLWFQLDNLTAYKTVIIIIITKFFWFTECITSDCTQ
jgi:hypothetical protein